MVGLRLSVTSGLEVLNVIDGSAKVMCGQDPKKLKAGDSPICLPNSLYRSLMQLKVARFRSLMTGPQGQSSVRS